MRELLPQGQPDRTARAGAPAHGGTRRRGRCASTGRDEGIERPWPVAERLIVCVGPGASAERTGPRRRAHGGAAARPTGSRSTSRRRGCSACPTPSATASCARCARRTARRGSRSRSAAATSPRRSSRTRARATRRASSSGAPRRDGLRGWLPLSAADRIVAGASDLEVVVVGREAEDAPASPAKALLARSRDHLASSRGGSGGGRATPGRRSRPRSPPGSRLSWTRSSSRANQVMIYLLAVALVAMRLGRGPSVAAAVASVAAFDFFSSSRRAFVRRLRHAVPGHLRGDARGGANHQRPGGERPHPRAHRGLPRAAHRGALRHEPRTGRGRGPRRCCALR